MTRNAAHVALALLALFQISLPAPAQSPPERITFQGRLTDAAGNPAGGSVQMTFKIHDDPLAGTLLWEETRMVTVTGGLYSVDLGSGTAFGATLFSGPRWLGIAIASDPEMTPRYPLCASPYAINAVRLGGKLPSDFAAASHDHALTGDVTGTLSGSQVVGLRGVGLSTTPPTAGQVLRYSGTVWEPFSLSGGTVTQVDTGAGLTGGPITTTGTISLDTSVTDARYYTQAVSDGRFAALNHNHDARYYTETEVDTALAGKLNLTGGTLTGALAGTTATFSGTVTADVPTLAGHVVTLGYANANYASIAHTHASNPLVSDVVAVSATTTTSSTSDVVVTGMTLTPVAGSYLVWFAGSIQNSTNAAITFPSIYAASSQLAGSEQRLQQMTAARSWGFCCVGLATVNGSQSIEGVWRVNSGTAQIYARTLTILKVQ